MPLPSSLKTVTVTESATPIQATVAVAAVNDAPTLTAFSTVVASGNEDSQITVTFADLQSQGNEADVDGSVDSFVIKAVSSGTLRIGASALTATVWNAATNNTVDAGRNAYWTPDANANGTLNAFTVVAKDSGGAESATPIQAAVAVTPVNDAPTLTTFSSAVASGNEDSHITVTFANLQAQGNEADVDGTVDSFVIKAVSSGTLKIGASAVAATAWNATTNNTVDAGHNVYWTPDANANGTLNAFTVVAKDNGGAESAAAIQARVAVTPVNDAPGATNLVQTISYTEDTTAAIADIVIIDPDADTFTATVIMAGGNSAIGSLSATSGKGETYNAATGVWTVTGTLTNVNAALAAMSFVPVANGFANTSASVSISDGVAPAITGTLIFNGTAVNDAPTLTAFTSDVTSGDEDKQIEVTFADLQNQGDAADVDGTVTAFVIKAVSSGSLKIGDSAETATVWAAGTNDVVDAAQIAFWTPAANANGTLPAFTVVAKDNSGTVSTTPIQAMVDVTAVNDRPTLTAFSSSVASGNEDSPITVTFANLQSKGNEADIDGTVTAFVIQAVSTGTLKIGTSAATATAWAFGNNDVVNAARQAYWTPEMNANGNLNAFTVQARDDGGAKSTPAIQATVAVTAATSLIDIVQADGNTSVTEGGATDTYTLALKSAPAANVTINLNTTNHQVTSDVNTLTFTAVNWAIPKTVTVTAVNDTVGEGLHRGVIQHTATSTDSRYNGIAIEVIVAITDNDLRSADPLFTNPVTNAFGLTTVGYNASPTFADIDGDGDLDAFVGKYDGNTLFYRNTGTASSPAFAVPSTNPFGLTNVGASANPTFVDIDGDGDLDAFVGKYDGNTLFYRNTGTASSPAFAVPRTNPFGLTNVGSWAGPTFADIDGDGDLDVFVGNNAGNTLFYRNTGTAGSPAFAVPITNPFGLTDVGDSSNPTFVDIDGDGDLDAFIGNGSGDTRFYLNTGTASIPTFTASSNNPFGLTNVGASSNPSFADIDGDGDLDVFVGNSYGDTLFYLNGSAPTLTAFAAAVASGNEDSQITVTFANLQAQGNEADVDGTVTAFVIKAVSSGTLKIGASAGAATAWAAGSNEVVDATHLAYWTPVANANGTLNAFTAVAQDNDGLVSATPIQAKIAVTPVNDAPTLTAFSAAVASGNEDSQITVSFADLQSQGNEADVDVDGTVDSFVIKAVSSGTLKIGTSALTATVWNANTNNTVDATHQAYWTPDANANGTLNAFAVVAKDNGGAESAAAIQAKVAVTPINDAPTLTAFSSAVANGNEDNEITVTFSNLLDQGNEADVDVDGTVDSFVIKAVSSGILKIGTSSDAATTWVAGSNDVVDATHQAYWTPAANANGTLNAFTAVAQDNDGLVSAAPIQAKVAVEAVNDAPTLTILQSTGADLAPVATGNEDSPITVMFGNLQSQGNCEDVDGTISAFVIKAVSSGSLKIGASAGAATAWAAGSNEVVDATHLAYWTPAANANGILNAFTAVAQDNEGLVSVTAIQATVAVTPVNDAPVLTTPTAITYTDTIFDDAFLAVTGSLVASDIDSNTLTCGITGGTDKGLTITKSSTYGALTVTKSTGAYSFVANDAAIEALTVTASASFTVTVADGLLSNSKKLTINIAQSGITESIGNDTLTGTSANDKFDGLAGNDIINGLAGADTLKGGLGNDVYYVDNAGDKVIETSTLATEIDTVNSSISYTLGANLENLTLTGTAAIKGTGNGLNNILTGNSGANTLNGGAGADTMKGGLGNDVYYVDNAGDKVIETSTLATEIDTVNSSISYTLGTNLENLTLTGTAAIKGAGNGLNNILTGNSGANTLNGGAGADTLKGGLGNDVYYVDNAGDKVIETSTLATEIDTVNSSISYTLGTNLENLTLTGSAAIKGTGNALNNILTGNSGANTLNGGAGADTLKGGLGNDVYYVDNAGDKVIETSTLATEIDTVNSSISYTLGTNLENLTLTGSAAIKGTGNALNNILTGNSGANTLNGGAGADTLKGGLGNDVYYVDNAGDKVSETSTLATEIDTVNSSISYTLGANLENLTLTGSAAIKGTGNALNNILTGNSDANTLNGGAGTDTLKGAAGNDVLTGGTGKDIFQLTTLSKDTITDFSVVDDTIQLENSVFTQLTAIGVLNADNFKTGATAADANDYVIYNSGTGALYYDADGSGAGVATQIAVLGVNLALTNADFVVI